MAAMLKKRSPLPVGLTRLPSEHPLPFFFVLLLDESLELELPLLLLPLLPPESESVLSSELCVVFRLQSPESDCAVDCAALVLLALLFFFLPSSRIVMAVILEESSSASKVIVLSGPADVVRVSQTAVVP